MTALNQKATQPFESFGAMADEVHCAAIPTRPDYYPQPAKLRQEIRGGRRIYGNLTKATGQMFSDLRVGRALDTGAIARPLEKMVASVIRNPEAMVWICRLYPRTKRYLVGHSVRTAVFAVVVGRGMGMAEPQLGRLAMAALLCQIGKTKLPMQLLEKAGPLSEEDLTRLRGHVTLAPKVLDACETLSPEISQIVENHLERFDGSGLPEGKSGDRIPVLARIVGMVEWYDAMTSLKPYTDRVLNATESMDYLYQQRNVLFHDQIVEEFVRALGIYPNGTLVELNTREVALVQAQNPGNRTRPQILLIRDRDGRDLPEYKNVDMAQFNRKTEFALTIKRALTPAECQLDTKRVLDSSCRSPWQTLFRRR